MYKQFLAFFSLSSLHFSLCLFSRHIHSFSRNNCLQRNRFEIKLCSKNDSNILFWQFARPKMPVYALRNARLASYITQNVHRAASKLGRKTLYFACTCRGRCFTALYSYLLHIKGEPIATVRLCYQSRNKYLKLLEDTFYLSTNWARFLQIALFTRWNVFFLLKSAR